MELSSSIIDESLPNEEYAVDGWCLLEHGHQPQHDDGSALPSTSPRSGSAPESPSPSRSGQTSLASSSMSWRLERRYRCRRRHETANQAVMPQYTTPTA